MAWANPSTLRAITFQGLHMFRSTAIQFAIALLLLPSAVLAQNNPADSGAYTLGRILGIALFCYIIWRIFFRKKQG